MALEHPWMPLPFQLDHINLWALADGDGWTAVDTGVALPPTRACWEQLFASALDGKPIRRVIVTHFHPDHIGNASWLTERWQADLWCTQTEWLAAEYALRSRDDADLDRRVAHYRRHGIAEEHTAKMRARGNPYPSLVGGLPFHFMPIADGETVTIEGRRWRVITARGHSPEHACLWCEDLRVLIAGDQVLPKITTNVSVWPERPRENPLRYYLDSLARFLRLPADTLILPSHGLPFRGLHHRLSTLVQHTLPQALSGRASRPNRVGGIASAIRESDDAEHRGYRWKRRLTDKALSQRAGPHAPRFRGLKPPTHRGPTPRPLVVQVIPSSASLASVGLPVCGSQPAIS